MLAVGYRADCTMETIVRKQYNRKRAVEASYENGREMDKEN